MLRRVFGILAGMAKDFDGWNLQKKQLHEKGAAPYYHQREVWWCSLGVNVGFEQDGTGEHYDRPVVVIRGFSPHVFFGVALTGRKKSGRFFTPVGTVDGREASAILSQVRLIDTRRLVRKIGTLDEGIFERLCDALKGTLFGAN